MLGAPKGYAAAAQLASPVMTYSNVDDKNMEPWFKRLQTGNSCSCSCMKLSEDTMNLEEISELPPMFGREHRPAAASKVFFQKVCVFFFQTTVFVH